MTRIGPPIPPLSTAKSGQFLEKKFWIHACYSKQLNNNDLHVILINQKHTLIRVFRRFISSKKVIQTYTVVNILTLVLKTFPCKDNFKTIFCLSPLSLLGIPFYSQHNNESVSQIMYLALY